MNETLTAVIEQPARPPHDVLEGEPATVPSLYALAAFGLALGVVFGLLWVLLLRGASGGGYRGGGPARGVPPAPPIGGSGGSHASCSGDCCRTSIGKEGRAWVVPEPCKTCSDKDKIGTVEPCASCGPPDWQYRDGDGRPPTARTPERSYCLLCRREVRTETGQVCDLCYMRASGFGPMVEHPKASIRGGGSSAPDVSALPIAFVQGAAWWEFHQTNATMWQSDRRLAEEEAAKRERLGTLGVMRNAESEALT